MKKTLYKLLLVTLIISSCKTDKKLLTAQEIIDKSIEMSKVDKLYNATLSFTFRDKKYEAHRNNGAFVLKRKFKQKEDSITDVLSNNNFQRFLNGKLESIPDSMALKYSESVNSVHYFSILPLGLNDKAVLKKKLQDVSIKEKEYYKIQVTFQQDGGGVDFEDVFVYWFDKETFSLDYLAYLYHTNGGGIRFREVTKEHIIDGIRLANYNNYKPEKDVEVQNTDIAFENGKLKKISEINLENISIK